MERTINSLVGCRMEASDGEVGKVDDVYFDDDSWTVRYLVLKTDDWLSGRKVLIAPLALLEDRGMTGVFRVNLTKNQLRQSPDIDTDKPVSRQQEIELYGHYSWKGYWESGFYAQGVGEIKEVSNIPQNVKHGNAVDLHLRAASFVTGFHVYGTDGEFGYICNFVIDDRAWKVLNLVVDTGHLPDGKKVLVAVDHIIQMQWNDFEVYLSDTKAEIEKSAVFEPSAFSDLPTAL
jgi:hypothetical protein